MVEDLVMGEKMSIGDYGEISFTIKKRRKYPIPGDPFIIQGYVMTAEVIDLDNRNVLIRDNDGIEYLTSKGRIRNFSPMPKPVLQ